MEMLLIFAGGVIVGMIIANILYKKRTSYGTLKVDTDDPDGPFLFLEMSPECMNKIQNKDTVVLKVENISPK